MKIRYKDSGTEGYASRFNTCGIGEVLTGDDSAFISDLDVYLEKRSEWKDMRLAFKDGDLETDNYNTCFFEARK